MARSSSPPKSGEDARCLGGSSVQGHVPACPRPRKAMARRGGEVAHHRARKLPSCFEGERVQTTTQVGGPPGPCTANKPAVKFVRSCRLVGENLLRGRRPREAPQQCRFARRGGAEPWFHLAVGWADLRGVAVRRGITRPRFCGWPSHRCGVTSPDPGIFPTGPAHTASIGGCVRSAPCRDSRSPSSCKERCSEAVTSVAWGAFRAHASWGVQR